MTIQHRIAEMDRLAAAAVDALLLRSSGALAAVANGYGVPSKQGRAAIEEVTAPSPMVREVANMPFAEICREVVTRAGIQVRERTPLGYASAFLQMTGQGQHPFAVGNPRIDGLMATALDGPVDYPSVMDGVANKIVTFANRIAPVTYPEWCARMSDCTTFGPREVTTFGEFGELPLHVDGKPYAQTQLPHEAAWLQPDEFGDEFVLTPRMLLQDPMDNFIRRLTNKQVAHERTLNRLAINLLTGNVNSPTTGNACYSHSNDIASGSGGAPSTAQAKAMRKLLNAQTLVGSTGEESGLDMGVSLVGSEWTTENETTFMDTTAVVWAAATAADVNVFRHVLPLYDPMLSAGSKVWYGTTNPMLLPGIVFGFVTGYGPGGRRITYWDPSTGAQHFQIQGAFAAALLHHEALVRNAGE